MTPERSELALCHTAALFRNQPDVSMTRTEGFWHYSTNSYRIKAKTQRFTCKAFIEERKHTTIIEYMNLVKNKNRPDAITTEGQSSWRKLSHQTTLPECLMEIPTVWSSNTRGGGRWGRLCLDLLWWQHVYQAKGSTENTHTHTPDVQWVSPAQSKQALLQTGGTATTDKTNTQIEQGKNN